MGSISDKLGSFTEDIPNSDNIFGGQIDEKLEKISDLEDQLDDVTEQVGELDDDDSVGMTDYDNFAVFTACQEQGAVYAALSLKLQSIVVGISWYTEGLGELLEFMMDKEQKDYFGSIDDINTDLGVAKLDAYNPGATEIPICLLDTYTSSLFDTSDEPSSIDNGINSSINGINSAIEGTNSVTSTSTAYMDEKANSWAKSYNGKAKDANKWVNKTMKSLTEVEDQTLFSLLDKLRMYIKETGFVDTYRNRKSLYECIKQNCKPMLSYLPDDDFLYKDKDHKIPVMPIEPESGNISLVMLYDEPSKEETKQLLLIQTRYYKYLQEKQALIDRSARTSSSNNVPDDENGFLSIPN